jgi:hypothetical protein
MTALRKIIEAQFREDWADIAALAGARVIATERQLDDVTTLTALIKQKSVGRNPQAPKSHRNVGMILTIISARQDPDMAQDELDEVLPAVLDYLDPRYAHEEATAVGWTNSRLAYDIPFTVIAAKTAPNPQEA